MEDPQAAKSQFSDAMLSRAERLGLARSYLDYQTNTIRIANADISGYSHVVASRQGLFAANRQRSSIILDGMFYGLTFYGQELYAFEACDIPRSATGRGRIIRLTRNGARFTRGEVVISGLDNGCHQIDFVDNRLHILDTYNQRIVRCLPDGTGLEYLRPLPDCARHDWTSGYVHPNSFLRVADTNLLLLHRGGKQSVLPSTVAVYDLAWRLQDTWLLPGQGCHSLAALEDGSLMSCGSLAGELIFSDGRRRAVTNLMTRGLSVGVDSIAVGASTFSSRRFRHRAPGRVIFLDRGLRIAGLIEVPGAPTEIRRLDGCDYSLSQFVQSRSLGLGKTQVAVPARIAWEGGFQ